MARFACHRASGAAASADRTDRSEAVVGPRYIDDASAVIRPCREEFEPVARIGEAARLAAGKRFHVKLAEGFEHSALAVRRHRGETRHGGRKRVRRYGHLGARRIDDGSRILHMERNFPHGARGEIEATNLAAGPEDETFRVRRPVHVRVGAVDGPDFLHVLIEIVVNLALCSGFQILQVKLRLRPLAADKGDGFSVRRRRRPDGAAEARHRGFDFTGRHFITIDVEKIAVRILRIDKGRAGRNVLAVVNKSPVSGEDRLAELFLMSLARPLDKLHAVAAGNVIEPDFADAKRTLGGEVLARREIFPVRRPSDVVEKTEAFLRHLTFVRAVDVHDPDIVAAATVGSERDFLAVRRKPRLHLPRETGRDRRRLAASDRDRVNVAEQVEGDHAPVGTDVKAHPCAFAHIDRNLTGRQRRRRHIPLFVLLLILVLSLRRRRKPQRSDHGQRRRYSHTPHHEPLMILRAKPMLQDARVTSLAGGTWNKCAEKLTSQQESRAPRKARSGSPVRSGLR